MHPSRISWAFPQKTCSSSWVLSDSFVGADMRQCTSTAIIAIIEVGVLSYPYASIEAFIMTITAGTKRLGVRKYSSANFYLPFQEPHPLTWGCFPLFSGRYILSGMISSPFQRREPFCGSCLRVYFMVWWVGTLERESFKSQKNHCRCIVRRRPWYHRRRLWSNKYQWSFIHYQAMTYLFYVY